METDVIQTEKRCVQIKLIKSELGQLIINGGVVCINPPVNKSLDVLIRNAVKTKNDKLSDDLIKKLNFSIKKSGGYYFTIKIVSHST